MSSSLHALQRSPEIRRVMTHGRRLTGTRMVLYVLPDRSTTRAGFACPRSIGGAVIRNRARRLMKEAWRHCVSRVRQGNEVMVVARPEIRGAKLREILKDLEAMLVVAGILE